jgi:hypothetical protein
MPVEDWRYTGIAQRKPSYEEQMLKFDKDSLVKFLKEDLPVIGVDLIIGGVKAAREVTDKAARLIAEGTIPAPGFIADRARQRIESQEDFYRVAEPEHGWDKCGFTEAAEKEGDKEAPARARAAAKPSRKKRAGASRSAAAKPARRKKVAPRKEETQPAEEKKEPAGQ